MNDLDNELEEILEYDRKRNDIFKKFVKTKVYLENKFLDYTQSDWMCTYSFSDFEKTFKD